MSSLGILQFGSPWEMVQRNPVTRHPALVGRMWPVNTFELTVERKWGDRYPIVGEHSAPHVLLPVRKEGKLQLDLSELNKATTPREYGTVLGRALFCDEVRDAFVEARPKGSADQLRVLLYVEAEDLRTLRWERLCGPFAVGWDFLALNQQVPYSLHLPSLIDRRFRAFGRRDLRALVVVASPPGLEKYGLQHFDVGAAVKCVRTALIR